MPVRLLLVLLLFVAFISGAIGSAYGAKRPSRNGSNAPPPAARAFLLAKDIHQWLDFKYQYTYSAQAGGAGNTTDVHTMDLDNSYHFDTLYAILRPKLLMGRLDMDVGFDGEWKKNNIQGSDTAATPAIQYNLEGTFLKDESTPVNFNSFYKKDLVDRVFARNYEIDSRGEGVGFSYQNPFLPTYLSYSQSASETSGLTIDRTGNSRKILAGSSHQYKNLSATRLNVMMGEFETQTSTLDAQWANSESVSWTGQNTLNLDKKSLSRSLDSHYSYSDSKAEQGNNYERIEDWNTSSVWSERLYWQLGSALYSGFDYRDSFFESQRAQQEARTANGWLRHQLFDNFSTSLSMRGRDAVFLQGTEKGWAGNLGVDYIRHLPKECNLSLGLDNSYGVTDRNLKSSSLQIFDEPFTYDATRFNYLDDYDIEIDTIVVRNVITRLPYDEGTDYIVEQIGRQIRIEIPRGSAISDDSSDDDTLSMLISYDYTTNPDIKYGSNARGFYSSLGLFDNSYRIAAHIKQASEELLEGDDANVSLADSTGYMLSIEKNIPFFTFKGDYAAGESTTEKYHYWGPSVEFNRYYNQYRVSARLRGRQTEYDEFTYRGITSPAHSENSISAQARLRKRLLWLPGAVWENKIDCRQLNNSRGKEETEVNVNSALQISVGKSRISLEGDVAWVDNNGQQAQEAFIMLQFMRFF